MPDLSVVMPVYNEIESLDTLYCELVNSLEGLEIPYELLFVDDCSSDGSREKITSFENTSHGTIRLIPLPERSGQTFALKKGLQEAGGNVVVTMDSDLQNDPADIPKLLKKMEEGYDMVCGWRKNRKDKFLKAILSKTGNFLKNVLARIPVHDISCTLRAFKKECVPQIKLDEEGQHRFIPWSLSKKGYKVGEIVSNHRQRSFGSSKYKHSRIFKVILDYFRILFSKG